MIRRWLRPRRRPAAGLLEAPLAGIERMREALPGVGLADIVVDLAARTGVDLSEVAERLFDRLGEVVARAGSEAEELAESDRGQQLRAMAARAAERAELAYRAGAERVLEAIPERRRQQSDRGLILLSAGLGLAAGAAIAYFLLSRPAERRPEGPASPRRAAANDASEPADGDVPALVEQTDPATATASASAGGLFGEITRRLTTARRAARAAQSAKERQLWREYRSDLS